MAIPALGAAGRMRPAALFCWGLPGNLWVENDYSVTTGLAFATTRGEGQDLRSGSTEGFRPSPTPIGISVVVPTGYR